MLTRVLIALIAAALVTTPALAKGDKGDKGGEGNGTSGSSEGGGRGGNSEGGGRGGGHAEGGRGQGGHQGNDGRGEGRGGSEANGRGASGGMGGGTGGNSLGDARAGSGAGFAGGPSSGSGSASVGSRAGGLSGGAGLSAGPSSPGAGYGGAGSSRGASSGGAAVGGAGPGGALGSGSPGRKSGAPATGGSVGIVTGNVSAPGGPVFVRTTGSLQHEPGDRDVALPRSLEPLSTGALGRPAVSVRLENVARVQAPLVRPAPVRTTVRACGATIDQAARRRGAVKIAVTEAGPPRAGQRNMLITSLDVEVVYERRGKQQVRRAQVACHLNARGQVIALR